MNRPHHNLTQTALTVGAIGVVYGDIGTSPLYTLRECFLTGGLPVTPDSILGILSLIAWALILVVTFKYVTFILRADNGGEGGILALTAQVLSNLTKSQQVGGGTSISRRRRLTILMLGLAGAALFYGDTLITPAISVLGAMEGLSTISPSFTPLILPLSLIILLGLFLVQQHGTATMGNLFGPVMLVWFGVLAVMGTAEIINSPGVLWALNPMYAVTFLFNHHFMGFLTLGAVVLAVTGAEALYADLGHFGRKPIQRAWLMLVGPALLLNYFGQGALLLSTPSALDNPFFHLVPDALRLPMVGLAAVASIIASQAVISGAFSLTHQAMQLGHLPRFEVRHTSAHQEGQIYLPQLNWMLMAGVMLVVLSFHTSSNLAAAYGIAVTGTMAITTLLATPVLRQRLGWPMLAVAGFGITFIVVDLLFLTANLHKIPHGGWFPLMLGGGLLFVMHTWLRGREVTHQQIYAKTGPLADLLAEVPQLKGISRPRRAAVYLTADTTAIPLALQYNLIHNRVLHHEVVLLTVTRARIPRFPSRERLRVTGLGHGFFRMEITYGFMESPNIPAALNEASQHHGLPFSAREDTSYFLSAHSYVPGPAAGGLNRWQEPVYMLLESLSVSAIRFFRLPRAQVVEIGDHIDI